jgi:hypothetical protein
MCFCCLPQAVFTFQKQSTTCFNDTSDKSQKVSGIGTQAPANGKNQCGTSQLIHQSGFNAYKSSVMTTSSYVSPHFWPSEKISHKEEICTNTFDPFNLPNEVLFCTNPNAV